MSILDSFISADGKLLVTELIDFLNDDLLNYEGFPDEYLYFIEKIFSDKKYFEIKNLWKLLHMLPVENLDKKQFHHLSLVISKNFYLYKEEMLCDMSCDFIARCCDAFYALDLFDKMSRAACNSTHIKCIFVELNIMLVHAKEDQVLRQKINDLANRINKLNS